MKNLKNYSQFKKSIIVGAGATLGAMLLASLPLIASAEMLTRQLELGMTGSDVSTLQMFLAKDATIYPQGLITGYFGSLTKSAVSNFQAKNGIANVGRVGPVTIIAINNQMNGDNASPWFNSINVSPTTNTVNISWNTNENASSVVYFGTSPLSMSEGNATSGVVIGGSSQLVSTTLNSSHNAMISNLLPNTTYYYVLYSRDGAGNESVTWPSTFKTNQ